MTDIYNDCYVEKEKREKEKEATKKTGAEKEEAEQQDTKNGVTRTELVHYYGGEFISLRGDVVARINEAYPTYGIIIWNVLPPISPN